MRKELEDLDRLRETLYYPIASPQFNVSHSTEPGDPTAKAFHSIEHMDERISEVRARLADAVSEILEWLYSEEIDSELRRIIICHYLEGMDWYKTTTHVLGYYGTDSARMRVYRYFDKV